MSSYREPCMCGASDCVACRGESAKFVNWCENCDMEEECEDGWPGGPDCAMKAKHDDAVMEEQLEAKQTRFEFDE